MASNPFSTKAIDSFLEYFKEAKPYHTKLLEVVEKYSFFESMDVNFLESIKKTITIRNDPLCKQTGFGLDYDDTCGYDAIDCCNLFDCSGGYGVVFDNSDLVASETIVGLNSTEEYFEVSGNHTDDTRFQILSVPTQTEIVVKGDASDLLVNHSVFLVVNMLPFTVSSNSESSLIIGGNHAAFIDDEDEFSITGTETGFNGKYIVRSASYDADTDQTTVEFHSFRSISNNDLQGLDIFFRNSEPNTGIYQVSSYVFDGTNTTITIGGVNQFKLDDTDLTEYQKGSIQFRTAFKYSREIDIDLSAGSESHNVLYSEYLPLTNRTRIYVDGEFLDINGNDIYTVGVDVINMFGYFFNGGYDGSPECLLPKETHIYTMMEESLVIKITDLSFLNMQPFPDPGSNDSILDLNVVLD